MKTRPAFLMKYVKIYPEKGDPYWKDGKEPPAKEIGATAAIGVEYVGNFVKEYEAHQDKYPSAEDNIRYCELKTGKSRDDCTITKREVGKRWV